MVAFAKCQPIFAKCFVLGLVQFQVHGAKFELFEPGPVCVEDVLSL